VLGFQTSVQGPGPDFVTGTVTVPGFAAAPVLELVSGVKYHEQVMLLMSVAVPAIGWMVYVMEKV
jgi:hypothetical protein